MNEWNEAPEPVTRGIQLPPPTPMLGKPSKALSPSLIQPLPTSLVFLSTQCSSFSQFLTGPTMYLFCCDCAFHPIHFTWWTLVHLSRQILGQLIYEAVPDTPPRWTIQFLFVPVMQHVQTSLVVPVTLMNMCTHPPDCEFLQSRFLLFITVSICHIIWSGWKGK
jgi:hypothetical protein